MPVEYNNIPKIRNNTRINNIKYVIREGNIAAAVSFVYPGTCVVVASCKKVSFCPPSVGI